MKTLSLFVNLLFNKTRITIQENPINNISINVSVSFSILYTLIMDLKFY